MNQIPDPKTLGEVRQLLGMFNFFKTNIPSYSIIIKPVQEKLKGFTSDVNRNTAVDIGEKGKEAIKRVKKILSSRPVLAYPDWNTIEDFPLKVYSDASKEGFGIVITQCQKDDDGKEI